eukprot:PhM_4_TR9508/c0_g1_i2/m.41799
MNLTCVLCLDILDAPVNLSCGHSACADCVEAVVSFTATHAGTVQSRHSSHRDGAIMCSLCRQDTHCSVLYGDAESDDGNRLVPDGGVLRIDRNLQRAIETFRLLETASDNNDDTVQRSTADDRAPSPTLTQCDKCNDAVEHALMCEQCSLTLCESCHAQHHRGKWQNHTVRPVSALEAPTPSAALDQDRVSAGDVCPRHPEHSAVAYSLERACVLCELCVQKEGSQHHTVVPLETLRNLVLEEVRDLLATLHTKKENVKRTIMSLEASSQNSREAVLSDVQTVRRYFADLRQQIDAHEHDVISSLLAAREKRVAAIDSGRQRLTAVACDVNKAMWQAQGSVGSVGATQLLRARDALHEACVGTVVPPLEPPPAVNVHVNPGAVHIARAVELVVGDVSSQPTSMSTPSAQKLSTHDTESTPPPNSFGAPRSALKKHS